MEPLPLPEKHEIGYPASSWATRENTSLFKLPESHDEETSEEFLNRANDLLLSEVDIFSDTSVAKALLDRASLLSKNDNIKFSKRKGKEVLERLGLSIFPFGVIAPTPDEDGIEFYRDLPRTRTFFSPNKNERGILAEHGVAAYVKKLFALNQKFLNSYEGTAYIKKLVDGKTIILLGGGDSVGDLLSSKVFKPKQVINIDPYLGEESIKKNNQGIYRSLSISATDPKLIQMNQTGEVPQADEIWAMFSVPCYLVTPEEIKNLFKNITVLLPEGGNARITPISLQPTSGDHPESFDQRKRALLDAVSPFIESPDFNVTVSGDMLKIHKIKKQPAKRAA